MIAADEELPGGVSSDIRIRQTINGPIVVKRALDRLKVVADWRANPDRSHIEVRALRAAATLIGTDHVPAVLWENRAQHMFAMTLADPRLKNWKQELLAGRVDLETAAAVGETLGLLHLRSSREPTLSAGFADQQSFHELRIDPFFIRVSQRTPDLERAIGHVVETMANRRSVLVHGDFSPKNLLVDGSHVVVLDFEVAHWGDPAFDLAFCSAHLILKGWRATAERGAFRQSLSAMLSGYAAVAGNRNIDSHLTRMTACLLLARIDGDSPIDYISDLDTGFVRDAARTLLLECEDAALVEALTGIGAPCHPET